MNFGHEVGPNRLHVGKLHRPSAQSRCAAGHINQVRLLLRPAFGRLEFADVAENRPDAHDFAFGIEQRVVARKDGPSDAFAVAAHGLEALRLARQAALERRADIPLEFLAVDDLGEGATNNRAPFLAEPTAISAIHPDVAEFVVTDAA